MSIVEKDDQVPMASASLRFVCADIEFSDVESEIARNLVMIDGASEQRI